MIKGHATAAAAVGTTAAAVIGIAGPSWAAAPTATTSPPPPKAGSYVGSTSQGLPLSLRVAANRKRLSGAHLRFRMRCADHRTLEFIVSPILARQPWRLNASDGTGFTRAFRDTTGERYWIRGRFIASGKVSGTLSTSWRSPHDGMCRSGPLSWQATRAR